jgi:hypothetical protein
VIRLPGATWCPGPRPTSSRSLLNLANEGVAVWRVWRAKNGVGKKFGPPQFLQAGHRMGPPHRHTRAWRFPLFGLLRK